MQAAEVLHVIAFGSTHSTRRCVALDEPGMNQKIFCLFIFVFVIVALSCGEKKEQRFYFVNDQAYLLSDEQVSRLTEKIRELDQTIGSQIVILIIESLNGEKIEDYSLRTAKDWGIGRKDYDDGVLITVSLNDRQMRIEVGYGLEKIIRDEVAARIIREDMVPKFQTENYYEGLKIAVEKIITLIKENKERVGQRF